MSIVGIEDIGVCADVEVAPDADIDLVQAQIWFEIEQYLNPPVHFYTLQECLDQGMPVEEIFDGPELKSGFIKAGDLAASAFRAQLRVSDIINRLMDIKGVIAVNNMLLTKYDAQGKEVKGAADPDWIQNDPIHVSPSPNKDKVSAAWLLTLSDQHQPRFYINQSRFLFYKNGLPFKPRMDEARNTLMQLRGETDRPKIKHAQDDLPIPAGIHRNITSYFPVQYSFPSTYGIGPEGLPPNASALRRAQAKQLKAYLMVFEQLLGNANAQIDHTADLFSLDTSIKQTYFTQEFSESHIKGYDELVKTLTGSMLQALAETPTEFRDRRNRFLNHIMARFGEQFTEYALLLNDQKGRPIDPDKLIDNKIAFLHAYPQISHDRGRAFDYTAKPCTPANALGLKKRISLLLGDPNIDQHAIVVEHLLLRPKFPGDALYSACTDDPCMTCHDQCGNEDPYSFHLTVVMPGSTKPYNTDIEMRRFAERTIQMETPSHLLLKICWVGDDGYEFNEHDTIIENLASLLQDKGLKDNNTKTTEEEALECAKRIHQAYHDAFRDWFKTKLLEYNQPETLKTIRESLFSPTKVDLTKLNCIMAADSLSSLRSEIDGMEVDYFLYIAQNGWQFHRFSAAWCKWLESNADWTQEHLQEWVERMLLSRLSDVSVDDQDRKDVLSKCAADILSACGEKFHKWMGERIKDGCALKDFTEFNPAPVTLCKDMIFNPDPTSDLEEFLKEHYNGFKEVSYYLHIVVDLLGKLSNTYPSATLHDCDDGSDENPVRLDQTALGGVMTGLKNDSEFNRASPSSNA